MFMGEYEHSIDAKGRTIVPAKLRENLGDTFVITKGLDGCLFGYAASDWEKFEGKLSELSVLNEKARKVSRYFLAGATSCDFDSQGRILIPANLREFAGLEKNLVFVGVAGRIEIWSKSRWDEINAECDSDIDSVIEGLSDLGINL